MQSSVPSKDEFEKARVAFLFEAILCSQDHILLILHQLLFLDFLFHIPNVQFQYFPDNLILLDLPTLNLLADLDQLQHLLIDLIFDG